MMKVFQIISIAWEWTKGKRTYFFGILMLFGAIGNLAGALFHGQIILSLPWIVAHWQIVEPFWTAITLGFAVLTGRAAIPTNYQPLTTRLQLIKEKFQK
jgi:lipoprotein signal peptidase